MRSNRMCSVFGCNTRSNKSTLKQGVTFYTFPEHPQRRQLWIEACNKYASWTPAINSIVCSKHFHDSSFEVHTDNIKRLKDDAVPKRIKQYVPKRCSIQNTPCSETKTNSMFNAASEPTSRFNQIKSEIIEDENVGLTKDIKCEVYGTHKKLDKDDIEVTKCVQQEESDNNKDNSTLITATISASDIKSEIEEDIVFSERDDNHVDENDTVPDPGGTGVKYLHNLDRLCEIDPWDTPNTRILKLAVKKMRYDSKRQHSRMEYLEAIIRRKNEKIEGLENRLRVYQRNPLSFIPSESRGENQRKRKPNKQNTSHAVWDSTEDNVIEEQELGERLKEQNLEEVFEVNINAENPLLD